MFFLIILHIYLYSKLYDVDNIIGFFAVGLLLPLNIDMDLFHAGEKIDLSGMLYARLVLKAILGIFSF